MTTSFRGDLDVDVLQWFRQVLIEGRSLGEINTDLNRISPIVKDALLALSSTADDVRRGVVKDSQFVRQIDMYRHDHEIGPYIEATMPSLGLLQAWDGQRRRMVDAYAQRPPLVHIVQNLIEEASVNVLYGLPGSFKTMLLQYLSLCVATGHVFLPTLIGESGRSFDVTMKNVAWIDYDQGKRATDARFEALGHKLNTPEDLDSLDYWSFPMPRLDLSDSNTVEELKVLVQRNNYGLICIDNVGSVTPTDYKMVDEKIRQLFDSLRYVADSTGCAFVVIHHPIKGKGQYATQGQDMYGSIHMLAALDGVYRIERIFEQGTATNKIKITNEKQRNGEPLPPFGAEFWYKLRDDSRDMEEAWFTPWEPAKNDRESDIEEAAYKIPSLLQGNKMNTGDLEQRVKVDLKLSRNQARTAIKKAVQYRLIVGESNGRSKLYRRS